MPSTIVLKITKKMNCGSCTGKVKAALEGQKAAGFASRLFN